MTYNQTVATRAIRNMLAAHLEASASLPVDAYRVLRIIAELELEIEIMKRDNRIEEHSRICAENNVRVKRARDAFNELAKIIGLREIVSSDTQTSRQSLGDA